jgi:hypothetical protein
MHNAEDLLLICNQDEVEAALWFGVVAVVEGGVFVTVTALSDPHDIVI